MTRRWSKYCCFTISRCSLYLIFLFFTHEARKTGQSSSCIINRNEAEADHIPLIFTHRKIVVVLQCTFMNTELPGVVLVHESP